MFPSSAKTLAFLLGLSMASGLVHVAAARDGDFFNAFAGNGRGQFSFTTGPVSPSLYIDYNDALHAPVAVQPDGKVVLAATVKTLAGQDFGVLRINGDGSRDASFGPALNGQSMVAFNLGGSNDDRANGVALDSQGNILVVGRADTANAGDCAIIRLTPDGILDTTFSVDGKATIGFDLGPPGQRDDFCTQIAVQRDGKILIVGYAQTGLQSGSSQPTYRIVLARLTTNGARDTTFNGNGLVALDLGSAYPIAFGLGIAEQDDGHVVVVGNAATPTFDRLFTMARLNADGTLDTGFGDNGRLVFGPQLNGYDHGDLTDAVPLPDGSIAVVGFAYAVATGNSDFYFARMRADGSFDSTFGNNGNIAVAIDLGGTNTDYAFALARDSRGRLVANGLATTDTGTSMVLVRLMPNGQLDSTFGSDGVQITSSTPPGDITFSEIGGGVAIDARDVIVAASLATVDGTGDLEAGVVELVGDTIFSSGFTP